MPKREAITVQGVGLTLSKIIWRRFRRPMPGVLEATLAGNPALADRGAVLPLGTAFDIVIPDNSRDLVARPVVRLWGTTA